MNDDVTEHISQIANFVQAHGTQAQLVEALREAMTDDSPYATLLVRRIPVLCNDVREIKNTLWWLSRISSVVGTILLALLVAMLTHGNIQL